MSVATRQVINARVPIDFAGAYVYAVCDSDGVVCERLGNGQVFPMFFTERQHRARDNALGRANAAGLTAWVAERDNPRPSAADRLDTVKSLVGEGVHASLRKFCESAAARKAYEGIRDMPTHEWEGVCRSVAEQVVRYLDKGT